MAAAKGLLLLGGAGAVGVLALAAAAGRREAPTSQPGGSPTPDGAVIPPVPTPSLLDAAVAVPGQVADVVTDAAHAATDLVSRMTWVPRVIARVMRHEGGYDAVNPNRDGAGLSFGILQWNRAGLYRLLGAMYGLDAPAFQRVFGPSWPKLLQAAGGGATASVDGRRLWEEPWLSRFRAAGKHPPFQEAQDRLAREGEHLQAAEAVARRLNVPTERALALFFDTAVQQGAGAADQVAARMKAAYTAAGQAVTVPYRDLLAAYAQGAADRARRTTAPDSPSSGRLRWVAVGPEWHLHAGSLDLYRDILSRRTAILKDPQLGDAPVRLA
ncbi:hypothetical protein L6R50_09130 [Myxococcota bacterium]|nr:hypothetical protein [Myxococcota bacterium]